MKYIIYKNNESVAVLIPSPHWYDTIENLAQKDVPQGAPYKIISKEQIPDDLMFQNAWEWDNNIGIKINIQKAKEIWKDKFRAARKPILEKLDVEFMKALEAGDIQKQQEIASKKQALRDVTNTPLPDDLEGIKNTWPVILNS